MLPIPKIYFSLGEDLIKRAEPADFSIIVLIIFTPLGLLSYKAFDLDPLNADNSIKISASSPPFIKL